jgi:hypothetical protein
MRSLLRTHLKSGFVWAMLPLAVLSGMPTPRCLCRASERPISCQCPCCKGKAVSGQFANAGQCCCCGRCCAARNQTAQNGATRMQNALPRAVQAACCVSPGGQPQHSTSCCVPVAVDPSVIAASVEAPVLSTVFSGVMCTPEAKQLTHHPSLVVDTGHLHCGPDADLVVVFRCLLI